MLAALKILVVDDNPTMLKLLCQSFEKFGELITATDGADVLLKAAEAQPDLIISDYSMPHMNGLEFFTKLRVQNGTSEIPFVFLASQKGVDESRRATADSVEDYIVKPFFVYELSRQVRHILTSLYGEKMEQLQMRKGTTAGWLSEMSLIDWMQSLEQGHKTCALTLRCGRDTWKLYFNQGQVTHAGCGSLKGDGRSCLQSSKQGQRSMGSGLHQNFQRAYHNDVNPGTYNRGTAPAGRGEPGRMPAGLPIDQTLTEISLHLPLSII